MIDVRTKNHVTVTGNQSAPQTIMFAHGFGTDQTSWRQVADAFKDDYRIVLYDNVGGGLSDPSAFSPNKYDNLDSYADDLIDICEHLQIRDAIMVAHSVSGMVSVLSSIRQPHFFSKMVLVGASPRYLNDDDYVGGFTPEDLQGLFQAMATNYFAWVSGFATVTMANAERPQLAQNFAGTLGAIRPDVAQSVARVIFESDYRKVLSKLDKDVLLLQTREDIAVPMEVAHYLNKHIKNSRLEVVNATGHFPHISAPAEIIKALKSFI